VQNLHCRTSEMGHTEVKWEALGLPLPLDITEHRAPVWKHKRSSRKDESIVVEAEIDRRSTLQTIVRQKL